MKLALAEALVFKRALMDLTPVKTGNLRNSYYIMRRGNEFVVINTAPYCLIVNFRPEAEAWQQGRYHFIERAYFQLEEWRRVNGIKDRPAPKLYFQDYGYY